MKDTSKSAEIPARRLTPTGPSPLCEGMSRCSAALSGSSGAGAASEVVARSGCSNTRSMTVSPVTATEIRRANQLITRMLRTDFPIPIIVHESFLVKYRGRGAVCQFLEHTFRVRSVRTGSKLGEASKDCANESLDPHNSTQRVSCGAGLHHRLLACFRSRYV